MVVNGLDLVDFCQQLRIGGLCPGTAWSESKDQAERNQKTLVHEATPSLLQKKHWAKE
jgi:hypothetical protein